MGICMDKDKISEVRDRQLPAAFKLFHMGNGQSQTGVTNSTLNLDSFQTPQVPIIFVLGGPGSGKITHSERICRETLNFYHINMTQILNYILKGTDLLDPLVISTRKATTTLMSIIQNVPDAEGFVISGYPRNMRDTGEYLENVGRLDGVVLINWKEKTLENQIEYGAKFGEVILELAKLELSNFRQYTTPVLEYFDYKGMLYVIEGERPPDPVYEDFAVVFKQILHADNRIGQRQLKSAGSYREYKISGRKSVQSALPPVIHNPSTPLPSPPRYHVVWIVGGPGSDKFNRVDKTLMYHPTWRIVHTGNLLWEFLSETKENENNERTEMRETLKNILYKGDLAPQNLVLDLIEERIAMHKEAEGFLITGFPRNIDQAAAFQERFDVRPMTILVDCSELELGRNLGRRKGRMDDNLEAARRRLEVYREFTLPLLKSLDEEDRLLVVDGDTEDNEVIEELKETLNQEIARLELSATGEDKDGLEVVVQDVSDDKTEEFIDKLEDEIDQEIIELEDEIAETYEQVEAVLEAPNGIGPKLNGHAKVNGVIHEGVEEIIEIAH